MFDLTTLFTGGLEGHPIAKLDALGNGVKAPRMEGMAFEDSLDGKPQAFNGSMFLNCFHGVVRACRVEPAAIGQQG